MSGRQAIYINGKVRHAFAPNAGVGDLDILFFVLCDLKLDPSLDC